MSEKTSNEETKLIYHIDEEPTPYLIKLNISPDNVTLGDFKTALNKPNLKYFVKSKDDDFGFVKEEIISDASKLPCFNGKIVIWLVTSENANTEEDDVKSTSSKASKTLNNKSNPESRPSSFHSGVKKSQPADYNSDKNDSDQFFNDSESVHSANQDKIAPLKSFKAYKNLGTRYSRMGMANNTYDTTSSMLSSDIDSTVIYDSEDESRMSTATGTTLSSIYACQPGNLLKKRSKHYFKRHKKAPTLSRASSFSSITDSTMSLNIVSVTLPMDTVTFLGISIVGQSNKASGDSGIYVGSIMKGGAVAHDGRIEPGDMLLEVNGISFENMSNDNAVKTLRDQVQRTGPITLVVAKCWDSYLNDGFPNNNNNNNNNNEYSFTLSRNDPILPIDPRAWVLHNNAMLMSDNLSMSETPGNMGTLGGSLNHGGGNNCAESTITAGSNGSLPMGASASMFMTNNGNGQGHFNQQQMQNRNGTPSLSNSLPENCRKSEGGGMGYSLECCVNLSIKSDLHCIIRCMRQPDSGLEIKDRVWLKIVIPNAFIGSDLVEWLYDKVDGFSDHKEAKKFASELLKFGFIRHTVNKSSFSEQCYYIFGDNADQFIHNGGGGNFVEPLDSVSMAGHHPFNQPQFFNSSNAHWHSNNNNCENQTNMIRVGSNSSCGQYSSVQSPVYPTPSTMSSGVANTSHNDSLCHQFNQNSFSNDTKVIHSNGNKDMSCSQIKSNNENPFHANGNQNFNTLASRLSMSTSSSGSSSHRFFSNQPSQLNQSLFQSSHSNQTAKNRSDQSTDSDHNLNSANNNFSHHHHGNETGNQSGPSNNNSSSSGNLFSRQLQGLTNLTFNGSNTSSTQRTITSNQTMITNATTGLENSVGLISLGNNSCSPTASSDALDIRPLNFKSPPPQPPPRLTPAVNQV